MLKKTTVLQRTKIHEHLVSVIMNDIAQGTYRIGEPLPAEKDLMEAYGVGRSAVREAVAKLSLLGLVDVRPGMRATVREPTLSRLLGEMDTFFKLFMEMPGGLSQLQELRLMLEVALARRVAQECTDEQIVKLARALKRCEESQGDGNAYISAGVHFHVLLAEFCGNSLLTSLEGSLRNWLTEQRTRTYAREGEIQKAHAAHTAIYEAIAARDPDRAEKAMRDHLTLVHAEWLSGKSALGEKENVRGNSPPARRGNLSGHQI